MSSVNFDPVFELSPDLREAAEAMRTWLSAHQEARFLDAGTLARELGSRVSFDKVVRVLAQLVRADSVSVQYRIALPDGTLSEEPFDDLDHIPPVVFDSSFQPVVVEQGNIVPVYLPHSA